MEYIVQWLQLTVCLPIIVDIPSCPIVLSLLKTETVL